MDVIELIKGSMSHDTMTQFRSVRSLRWMLTRRSNNLQRMEDALAAGIIPHCIQLAQCSQLPMIQFDAVWILSNYSEERSPTITQAIIDNQAYIALIQMLRYPSYQIQEMSLRALGHIAGNCKQSKDLLLFCEPNLLSSISSIISSEFDKQYVTNYDDNDFGSDGNLQHARLLESLSSTILQLLQE